ncbi:MAG: Cof-type HAD-IIB family hydrolase [Metamycoplasmataceae bacterium]
MREFKWIITDLDGTLIDHTDRRNKIYPEVIDEIHRAIEGKKFAIATGRHYKDVLDINKKYNIIMPKDSYIIGLNGCQIYAVDTEELLLNRILEDDIIYNEIPKIIDYLNKRSPHDTVIFAYGEDENIYFIRNDAEQFDEMIKDIMQHEDNDVLFKYSIVDDVRELQNISKFCVKFVKPIENPLLLINNLRSISDKLDYANTNEHFIEIIMKDINKATALEYINENFYNFDKEEMLAFGDSGNDIEMLDFVGVSVTRHDARPEIIDIATKIYKGGPSYFVKIALKELVK